MRKPDINIQQALLGFGLDMPWHKKPGFFETNDSVSLSPETIRFLKNYQNDYAYMFFSFQPRHRRKLVAEDYFDAYELIIEHTPQVQWRALHHTLLNTGSLENYERRDILKFTNDLIKRFDLKWVNEDLGIWFLKGKSLPYPLPPILNADGLKACIKNVSYFQENLAAPFLVEFPGFSEGGSFQVGGLHAYDYFFEVVTQTQSPATLDTGHLLGYQWSRGLRGSALFSELAKLPLENVVEIHLSGCQIINQKFFDFHHGILLDEQIDLLRILLPLCPNLVGINFEDPKFDSRGTLIQKAIDPYKKLKSAIDNSSNTKGVSIHA